MSLWTTVFKPALIQIGLKWVQDKVLGSKEVERNQNGGRGTSKETGFGC